MVGSANEGGRVEALLERHRTMLRGYLRHLTASRHDADDLLQEVCVQALQSPNGLATSRDPSAYLRGMARHLAGRHRRRAAGPPPLAALAESAWEMDGKLEASEAHAALARCLDRLGSGARRALALRYEEGLSSTDIGRRLGKSAEAVRMALARTRQALARCLAGQGISAEDG